MPAAEVELCHGNEALDGVVYIGQWQHELWMSHEAKLTEGE